MIQDLLLQIRGQISKNRPDLPQFPSYLGPWGLYERVETERAKGNHDEKVIALGELLEQYFRTGNTLLEAQIFEPSVEALRELLPYCLDAVNDPYCHEADKVVDILLKLREKVALKPDEETVLLYIVILGYRRGNYPWRARPCATRLRALIKEREVPANIYNDLSAWYKVVLDYASACDVALSGAEILLSAGKTKQAAALARDGYACAMQLPEFAFPSEEEIKARYGEFADLVLNYASRASLKHDPVETTEKFQAVYDEVMEEATARYLSEPGAKVVQMLWSYMAEAFLKRDIVWSDPQLMNPSARFD